MPRGGDDDADVDKVYDRIEGLLYGARALRRTRLLGGDWNATVGARQPSDDADVVGPRGIGHRNARRQML
eukprot:4330310-Pyramimonas_sp.AAC.1